MGDFTLSLLNEKFTPIYAIDNYESCIWTDRFNEAGDFEIVAYISDDNADEWYNNVSLRRYISNSMSNHTMCIDNIQITMDENDGKQIKITGHSLEYILHRRIVWELYPSSTYDFTKLGDVLQWLLESNLGTEASAVRRIPEFYISPLSFRTLLNKYTIDEQSYFGQNLYDAVTNLCKMYNIGFSVIKTDGGIYAYAYETRNNTSVMFSDKMGNLTNAQYNRNYENWVNCIRYSGNDANNNKYYMEISNVKGLERREMYLDTGINQKYTDANDQEQTLSVDVFKALMKCAALKELNTHGAVYEINGEINASNMNQYCLGDVFILENETKNIKEEVTTKAMITEIIYSNDSTGFSMYPTFVFM